MPLFASNGPAATFLAEGYSIRVWQTEDGLPQNLVTSAVQTRDGYLWFGTESGLARFDGERFKVFNSANTPALRDRRIARLFEDEQGALWIGHYSGAISRYRDGAFESFAAATGAENERIIGLGSDEHGRLWAMRENGAIDSLDSSHRLPSLIAPNAPETMGWTCSAEGNIWVVENGAAARLADGRLSPLSFPPPRITNYAESIGASAAGGIWVVCDGRIRRWNNNAWAEDRGAGPEQGAHLLLELHDGTLALGTLHDGLYLRFPGDRRPVHFDRANGLPQDWVRFLYEDREGNLWVGTGSVGLISIRPTAFSVLNAPDQWKGCTVLSVAPGGDDSLWVGTDGAGVYHHDAGEWRHYGGDDQGLGNQYIWSVTETPAGDVWAGNYWWGGPYRLTNGRFVRPPNVDETWSAAVALVPVPETGELLVGNRDGLLRLKDGEPSRWLIKSPGGSTDDVCAVVRDRAGIIWCGFAQGGLTRLADGKLSNFRRTDGLGSDAIQCLYADEDGSLWIGTADSGLTRFKGGKFTNLGRAQGLADDVVSYILDDNAGYLWLSTHHGIQRVARDELNRCADGLIPAFSSQIYDASDGLPVVEFTGGRQAAGCKTSDGRLWFTSSRGLLSVDPSRIQSNPLPPPVVVDSLLVDGASVRFAHAAVPERLRPDHERLEFRFSGLSFVAPSKVLFKYQLEGIDKTWVDAGAKRTTFYSRLPAGTYRFRVIACNNDGVWNTEGASLAFTIAPFFWQTWWFIGVSVAAATTGVAFSARHFTRRRMQRRMELLERQHALERERARIAQDIHDDVGASLSRIAMLSQPAPGDLADPERASAMLSRIYKTAREVMRALDEIVWAVDPRHDTLDSLVDYMGKYAQHFFDPTNVRCRLDLPVQVPAWPLSTEIRHNLFLAFKEALNNAAKHATADEVRISFGLRSDSFVLTVQDNGRGFEIGRADSSESDRVISGSGLANMKARLARIGGRCEISSCRGEGTSISLIVGVTDQHARTSTSPSGSRPPSQPVR